MIITEKKTSEIRVSEFHSTISHERRTPLMSVKTGLGLMHGVWSSKTQKGHEKAWGDANDVDIAKGAFKQPNPHGPPYPEDQMDRRWFSDGDHMGIIDSNGMGCLFRRKICFPCRE